MAFELTEQVQRHLSNAATMGLTAYSRQDVAKLRHIEANDQVSLHFNQDATGGDVVVISGRARRMPDVPLPTKNPACQGKYATLVQQAGFTAEFLGSFSVAIQITPERVWAMP